MKHSLIITWFALSVTLLYSLSAAAATISLYDASMGGNPGSQGWLARAGDAAAVESVTPGGTMLDTTADAGVQSGYSNFLRVLGGTFPTLTRPAGFRLRFTVRIGAEAHASPHRAGFSVIALAEDLRGIELGFWEQEIWAQEGGSENLFTKAESAPFDTTQPTTYDLTIEGDTYTLASGGSTILTSPLRDYTAFTGFPDVYEVSNFLFFGDNTTSAQASVTLSLVSLTIPAPLAGDTNGDGQVDIIDLNNVRNHFGATAPPGPTGDTNGDGRVDIIDLNEVRNHFGATSAVVPEPSAGLLCVAGCAMLICQARRQRR